MATLELGVLVSGRGSNLQAILDAIADGRLDARVRTVISNKESAYALERARALGIPTTVIRHVDFPNREAFDTELVAALRAAAVEWIVLAGFMRVLTPVFLRAYPNRVVNIHPALLPSFPGTHGQRQALEYGVKLAGCTVHFVDEGVDSGPILAQAAVPVLDDDTEDTLSARILVEEHRLLVETLAELSQGRFELVTQPNGRTRVRRTE
jgi:phosphoribosylglycinamide formyltransferase-1